MMDDIDRSFDWYHAALGGERGPIEADHPKSGFYRAKSRDGALSAVAIWYDSFTGLLRFQQNGKDIDDLRAREMWPFVSKNPISEQLFWQFLDTGLWGDIDATVQGAIITGITIHDDGKTAEVRVEIPPERKISGKIAEARSAVPQYLKIESDTDASRAQSLRSTLTSLKGEAKKQYDALNRPLLDEQKRIRSIWNPIMDDAEAASSQLRSALEDWELSKRKAAQAAEESGVKPNMPAPSAKISGGMGRAASAKPYIAVTEIDLDKCFQQFRLEVEVSDVLFKLAQRAIDAGISVPGARTEEKVRVR